MANIWAEYHEDRIRSAAFQRNNKRIEHDNAEAQANNKACYLAELIQAHRDCTVDYVKANLMESVKMYEVQYAEACDKVVATALGLRDAVDTLKAVEEAHRVYFAGTTYKA